MAHGRPVVAPDVGGCHALVRGGAEPAGLIVTRPVDDLGLADIAPPTADALLELAMDPPRRERMGRAGRQLVRGHSVEAVAQRYREMYNELVEGGVSSPRAA